MSLVSDLLIGELSKKVAAFNLECVIGRAGGGGLF